MPDSVQAVLATRIDLLPAGREGRAAGGGGDRARLLARRRPRAARGGVAGLRLLEARDFIRRRSGPSLAGEREFAFKHALTREVAYASVPRARRAQLHARFAAWVERVADGRDEHAR